MSRRSARSDSATRMAAVSPGSRPRPAGTRDFRRHGVMSPAEACRFLAAGRRSITSSQTARGQRPPGRAPRECVERRHARGTRAVSCQQRPAPDRLRGGPGNGPEFSPEILDVEIRWRRDHGDRPQSGSHRATLHGALTVFRNLNVQWCVMVSTGLASGLPGEATSGLRHTETLCQEQSERTEEDVEKAGAQQSGFEADQSRRLDGVTVAPCNERATFGPRPFLSEGRRSSLVERRSRRVRGARGGLQVLALLVVAAFGPRDRCVTEQIRVRPTIGVLPATLARLQEPHGCAVAKSSMRGMNPLLNRPS